MDRDLLLFLITITLGIILKLALLHWGLDWSILGLNDQDVFEILHRLVKWLDEKITGKV